MTAFFVKFYFIVFFFKKWDSTITKCSFSRAQTCQLVTALDLEAGGSLVHVHHRRLGRGAPLAGLRVQGSGCCRCLHGKARAIVAEGYNVT